MNLQLLEPVQIILKMVEEKSGKRIAYVEKEFLNMQAKLRLAGRNSTEHQLLYRGEHDETINYVIANQCGHILRIIGADEARRFFPVANNQTMMQYVMDIQREVQRLSSVLDEYHIKNLIALWYKSIVFQLTKMPPDIQIEKWLYDEYPELRTIQMKAIEEQLGSAVQGSAESVRTAMPYKVYHVSNIMNYAFFKILEDHFCRDFVRPYYHTVFLFEGGKLARITEREYVNTHEGDIDMINTWATHLDLTGWFEWKHYSDMPEDYILF